MERNSTGTSVGMGPVIPMGVGYGQLAPKDEAALLEYEARTLGLIDTKRRIQAELSVVKAGMGTYDLAVFKNQVERDERIVDSCTTVYSHDETDLLARQQHAARREDILATEARVGAAWDRLAAVEPQYPPKQRRGWFS
jgi:hypothetical protein